MDYAASCKVSNYDKAVKRQLVAGTVFLWVFKRQGRFSKCDASVNLRVTLEQYYLTFEAQELCTATWQAQKHTLPVDKSPSILPLVYSLVLSDSVFCMQPQLPSFLWSPLLSMWCHSCEVIWLERQHSGAWNKKWNRLVTRLYFSLRVWKNSLRMRLVCVWVVKQWPLSLICQYSWQ